MCLNTQIFPIIALLFCGLFAPALQAQTSTNTLSVYGEANGGYVEGKLHVKLPLLGQTTLSAIQRPIAQASFSPGGGSKTNQVASTSTSLGGLSVLAVNGVDNTVEGTAPGSAVTASAMSQVAEATLLGGLVRVKKLVARVDLSQQLSPGSLSVATVSGSTNAEELVVAGVSYRLGEIPPNTTVPLGGTLTIPLAGLTLHLPITGTVVLNEQLPIGPASGLTVNAVDLHVTGALPGLADLSLDIVLGGPGDQVVVNDGSNPPPGICTDDGDYYHSDPDNCRRFYQCDLNGDVDGHLSCPEGTLFNDKINVCDWPDNVDCNGAPTVNLRRQRQGNVLAAARLTTPRPQVARACSTALRKTGPTESLR